MSPEEKPLNAGTEEKSAAEIRTEIEETREELGDTVEALAEKTDVKAQAKAKVEDVKVQAKENPKPAAIAAALIVLFVLWRLLRS
jgi:predicted transcriptional regulator